MKGKKDMPKMEKIDLASESNVSIPVNRKEREYQLRRELIIDVSEKLFYKKGYENVTLGDIAKHAEYTKKTLYSYITSKAELYLEVYYRGLVKRRQYIADAMEKAKTGLEKILVLGESYFAFFRENPQMLLLVQYFDYRGIEYDKVEKSVVDKFITFTRETNETHLKAFQLGLTDGTINPDISIEIAYSQFILCLRAITHQAIISLENSPEKHYSAAFRSEYFQYFLKLFLHGIATKPMKLNKFTFPETEEKE
ncbi:MAG: TetR/AcrR family transcriptional regulator [Candidatus Cloacimonetes bacterium]|nr:TetR/AcrR family transcriptional regulator [Candidatus Cloacimonadota bacterium]